MQLATTAATIKIHRPWRRTIFHSRDRSLGTTSGFAGREPTNESANESRDSTFAKVSRDTTVVRGNVGARVPSFHAASYRESAVQAAFPAIRGCFLSPDCLALNGVVT